MSGRRRSASVHLERVEVPVGRDIVCCHCGLTLARDGSDTCMAVWPDFGSDGWLMCRSCSAALRALWLPGGVVHKNVVDAFIDEVQACVATMPTTAIPMVGDVALLGTWTPAETFVVRLAARS